MTTSSKRVYAISRSAASEPLPLGMPLLNHTSAGDTQTQFWLGLCVNHTSAGDTQTQFWLGLCGISWSWYTQDLFEPSKCLWWIWGLILNAITPHLPSCWGFSFALGHGVSFFGGIQHSPANGCSAVSFNFGVIAEDDEHTSSYFAILQCLTTC